MNTKNKTVSRENLILTALTAFVVASCNGGGGGGSGGGGGGAAAPKTESTFALVPSAQAATPQNAGTCTVQNVAGGVSITCSDGSVATVLNGSNGAQGIQGLQGLQGPQGQQGVMGPAGQQGATGQSATQLHVYDANNVGIGTDFIMQTNTGGLGNNGLISVVDAPTRTYANYNLNDGTMEQVTIYYSGANCGGSATVFQNIPSNRMFANGATTYKVGTTNSVFTPLSYRQSTNGSCINAAAANGRYTAVSTYSNNMLPYTVTLPLRVDTQ